MKFTQFLKLSHSAYSALSNVEGRPTQPVATMSAQVSQLTNSSVPSSQPNSLNTQAPQPSKFKDVFYGSFGWDHRGRWIIQKFLKIGKVGIFAGASQSFKTFVLLRISLCVAKGLSIGVRISGSSGHPFRCEPASRFGIIRPPISV